MSNDIVKSGLAIGGLGITYQATIIDGKTLAFETAIDSTVDREELDDFMDKFILAAKRQQAMEELPLVKQSLVVNLATLRDQQKQRAAAVAEIEARYEAANANRRAPKPLPAGGADASVMQHNQMIAKVEAQIAAARARIPYLQAIIDRREPPEPFPHPAEADGEDAAAAA